MNKNNLNQETLCVSAGWCPKKGESRQVPIFQSTTFKYETSEQMANLFDLKDSGYFYTRLQNPTNDAVAAKIAAEKGLSDGFRVVTNCGDSAGQTVKHLHFHLLAGRDMTWPPG